MVQTFPATMPCLGAACVAFPHLLRAVAKTLNTGTVFIKTPMRTLPGLFELRSQPLNFSHQRGRSFSIKCSVSEPRPSSFLTCSARALISCSSLLSIVCSRQQAAEGIRPNTLYYQVSREIYQAFIFVRYFSDSPDSSMWPDRGTRPQKNGHFRKAVNQKFKTKNWNCRR